MYCSWIARHPIHDITEKMVMDVHSFFAIICMMVFMLLMHPVHHRIVGKLYLRIIMPILFITGMILSVLPERGHVIYDRRIFQMYGLTFLISNMQLLCDRLLCEKDEFIIVYTWTQTLYDFFMMEKRMLRYELTTLMIPMILFTHVLPNYAVIKKNHEFYGILSIYIGSTGMIFTLTQSIRSFFFRVCIQNIPFVLACYFLRGVVTFVDTF